MARISVLILCHSLDILENVRSSFALLAMHPVEYRLVTYSSTEPWENGTLSNCLGEAEKGLIIHRNRANVRMTVKVVRL